MSPPGFLDLKQAQMCTNFRRFVPPKFKDWICPKPPDLLTEKVKIQRKENNKASKNNNKTQFGNVSNEASVLTAAKNII